MRKYGAPIRTYGKTSVGWQTKTKNLWAEVEAEEEARRQQEKERLETEEKKRLEEEEERRKRKRERKERKRREAEERSAVERENAVEGIVEGVSKLDMRGEEHDKDEMHKQIAAEGSAGLLDPSVEETPPTSPEKDEDPPAPAPPSTPPKKQPRRATIISTTPLSPRPITPQNLSTVSIETVPPTPGSPPPPSATEDNISEAPRDNGEDGEQGEERRRSSILGRKPTSPLLTPDRRGGLRRKSSRLTISPETSRGVSPVAEIPRLQLNNGAAAVGTFTEEIKVKGLTDKHRERPNTSSMISVAITPARVKVGIAADEYQVYSDHEEEKEGEKEDKEDEEAPQPKHNPTPEETYNREEEEEEDDWLEWGRSAVTVEELNRLLSLCTVNEVLDFSDHIQSELKSSILSKLGEASYSEVFLQTPHTKSSPPPPRTVLKIIPFGYPTQCPLKQIHDELLITATMAPIAGFIGFHSAHIVRGSFPTHLLDLWDHWDQHIKAGGSENDRPDFYNEEQLFAVIGLEDGGRDLEAWSFKGEAEGEGGWKEAREVFWRVAGALARGEAEREFEHRDLHFGNIVIKRAPIGETDGDSPEEMFRDLSLDDYSGARGPRGRSKTSKKHQQKSETPPITRKRLHVSLIDYTLSRARCPNGILSFTPLDDEALFGGKGDYQFDIYRFMRSHLLTVTPDPPLDPHTGLPELDWSQPTLASNLYWLHYLLHILLHKKKELRKPPAQPTSNRSRSKGPSGSGAVAGFSEEDVLAFKELEGLYKVLDCRPRGSKRGGAAGLGENGGWSGFTNGAKGFVEWALREGVVEEEDL